MTSLRALALPVAPDPVGLARALAAAGLEHVCVLHAAEPPAFGPWRSFVAAAPVARSAALDPFADEAPTAGAFGWVPRWIGAVPFEAVRYERPAYRRDDMREAPRCADITWLRFAAVLVVDHDEGHVLCVAESAAAARTLARAALHRASAAAHSLRATDADPPELHLARVHRAVELIRAGDLYQVNLARRLDVALEGAPLDAYAALAARSRPAYGAALDLGAAQVLSTSPELCLHGPDARGTLWTEPIKGTRPRGADAAADRRLAAELDSDEKERAELAMIVDVERNDLGRVAAPGSVRIVRPAAVATHRTIHHRSALLAAHTRPGASRADVLAAMLPSGSVTGAPKIRAMEVIAELEAHRRGLYTGALGYASHDGCFTLAMAIRTAVLTGTRGEYFTGGGIVLDSDPARELEETRWKAVQLGSPTARGGAASVPRSCKV
jgi:anthranilate/para-aminobenzoate synthase component I